MRADREGGQAAVELVALLPLVLAVALTAATVLAGLAASEQAGQAAEAGAIALIQGRDARAAARGAIPGLARSRTEVAIAGSRVTVRVRPPVPLGFLVAALEATATADAGPEPGW
ncbi:MAG TPA: hypothetical protein VFP78_15525 [Solirubrobacteraceae bacterium]|nr:hypothetical protein [Solirubrobacteraceae bacterium]